MQTIVRGFVGALVAMTLLLGLWVSSASSAVADDGGLVWSAKLGERDLAQVDPVDPVRLTAQDPVRMVVQLANTSTRSITVRSVVLQGRVMGLSFFRYSVRLDVTLAPGETTERNLIMELDDLAGQATGLLPAQLTMIDQDRRVIGEPVDVPVRVDGSVWSVYGVFGLAVAAITLVLLVGLLIAISRRTLPANRWRRAVRFLLPGLGIGLTLTFSLSAASLLLPRASSWLIFVVGCGAVGFLLGYLVHVPHRPEDSAEPAPSLTSVGPGVGP